MTGIRRIRSHFFVKAANLLVTAGFVAWSATQVAGLIWHVSAPDTTLSASGMMEENAGGLVAGLPRAEIIDLQRMQSVFVLRPAGQYSMASEPLSMAAQAADTRLALTLKGAVASSNADYSRAIIASADTQNVYRAGDSLLDVPGSVVLQEIHQTYVLLNNNGLVETLRMDEPEAAPESSTTTPQTANNVVANTAVALPAGVNANTALTDLVRIQPVFEPAESARAGALRGLQIRHGSRQDFLAAVGLQQGDLITAVDGKQLDSADDLPALMAQLSSQQAVSLQVQRDRALVTVELDRRNW